ncbi:response regulator [Acanthopleuribacter pedis]|uniref:histidine kinase n=1 Tax=Acanthopleuribacter pedis TaxID=442870 RepID=A0A8J7U7T7_9BACT|nr:response regulator [Acanthopleuribacter pedis]MBO1321741.1 response regulator [Acanthopleuribacter pedis]
MQIQSYTWLLEQWMTAEAANRHEADDEHALAAMLHAFAGAFGAQTAVLLTCAPSCEGGLWYGWRIWALDQGHLHGQPFSEGNALENWWPRHGAQRGRMVVFGDAAPHLPDLSFLEPALQPKQAVMGFSVFHNDGTRACLMLGDPAFALQTQPKAAFRTFLSETAGTELGGFMPEGWTRGRLHRLEPLVLKMADWAGKVPHQHGLERFFDMMVRKKNLWFEIFARQTAALWVLDAAAKVVFANQAALALTESDLAHVLGKPLWDPSWGGRAERREHQLEPACAAALDGEIVDLAEVTLFRRMNMTLRPLGPTDGCNYVLVYGRPLEADLNLPMDREYGEQLAYFEKLERINQLLRGKQVVGDMLDAVKSAMLDVFDCDRVWLLYPCNPEAERYTVRAEQTRPRFPGAFAAGLSFEASQQTRQRFRELLAQDWPLQSVFEGGYPSEIQERFQVRSELMYALRPIDGDPWVLGIHQCSHARAWSESDKRLLRDIGLRVTDALGHLLLLERLRESRAKYKNLYEQAMVGIFRIRTSDDTILLANAYCRTMLGYHGEFQGPIHLKHHFESKQDLGAVKRRLKEQGSVADHEILIKPNNKPAFWIKVSARYFAEDGFVEGVALDIDMVKRSFSALEESEERLSSTLLSIGDGVIASDIQGRIVRINPVAAALTGWAVDDAVGQPVGVVYQTYEPEEQTALPDPAGLLLRDEHAVLPHRDVVLSAQDGEKHLIQETGSLIRGNRGNLWGTVIVFRDVGAERELENELNQVRKLESIGLLAGGIAHDFNNLLNGILGYSEMLVEDLEDRPELQNYARVIGQTCRRAADLVYQLLSFSRKGKRKSVSVDLHALLGEVVSILRRTIDRRIEIKLNLAAVHHGVLGDPSQLESALINLGVNARDAMPGGGKLIFETQEDEPDVTFCTKHGLPPGRYLKISVCDDGSGMSPETLDHIFEPFFTTKEPGHGTGLGLAAVFGTIKSHNGLTRVHSELGRGTTFHLWLPLQDGGAAVEEETADTCAGRFSGRVLVVEDEEVLRSMAANLLQRMGYEVFTAVDGLEAVTVFEAHHAQLDWVLLDMVMPRLNGSETLVRLRALNPRVPVVMTSGFSVDQSAEGDGVGAADGFIQKPFGKEELSRMIAMLFETPDG